MRQTRSHRTPASIWVIVGLWSLVAVVQMVRFALAASPHAIVSVSSGIAIGLAALSYQSITLVRLGRWPILLQAASCVATLISRHLAHFDWRHRYPMLGPFVVIIPLILYLACTLPHWRKMNWSLFGRPYRPAEDQVEVFT